MKRLAALTLLLASCMDSEEETARKDREESKKTWAIVVKVDGADVRLPLQMMNVLLYKDDEYAGKHPSPVHIEGEGVNLYAEIAPADNVGYGEKWENLIGKTITIKPAGQYHREDVESKLTLPGKDPIAVTGGSMTVEKFTGKWSGSEGNKTLSGKIKLTLYDGRTLEGTFAVHAVTWG